MKKQNKLRLNPEELCLKTLQEISCKATVLLKVLGTCENEDAFKKIMS